MGLGDASFATSTTLCERNKQQQQVGTKAACPCHCVSGASGLVTILRCNPTTNNDRYIVVGFAHQVPLGSSPTMVPSVAGGGGGLYHKVNRTFSFNAEVHWPCLKGWHSGQELSSQCPCGKLVGVVLTSGQNNSLCIPQYNTMQEGLVTLLAVMSSKKRKGMDRSSFLHSSRLGKWTISQPPTVSTPNSSASSLPLSSWSLCLLSLSLHVTLQSSSFFSHDGECNREGLGGRSRVLSTGPVRHASFTGHY